MILIKKCTTTVLRNSYYNVATAATGVRTVQVRSPHLNLATLPMQPAAAFASFPSRGRSGLSWSNRGRQPTRAGKHSPFGQALFNKQ